MKKSDLKNGTVVQIRRGDYALILLNVEVNGEIKDVLTEKNCWANLSNYSDDLINRYTNDYDIMKVYKAKNNKFFHNHENGDGLILLWDRLDKETKIAKVQDKIDKIITQLEEAQRELDELNNN